MERKIGEIFEFEGVKLQVVEHSSCKKCFFWKKSCLEEEDILGRCNKRKDGKCVVFKKVKKT